MEFVIKNRVHELPVILHHRALTGLECMGLGPSKADADAEISGLGVIVHAARVVSHVKSWNAQFSAGLRNGHERIEHRGGPFDHCLLAVTTRLEPDAIHRALDFRDPDDLFDLLTERGVLTQVDYFTAKALGLLEPLRNHVADNHDRSAEQL